MEAVLHLRSASGLANDDQGRKPYLIFAEFVTFGTVKGGISDYMLS